MSSLEKDALKYDLNSLKELQNKRKLNISLFEESIKKERESSNQEDLIQLNLENKLRYHQLGLSKLSDTDLYLINQDLPKIKSTKDKRNQTIMLLKVAINEEQEQMDYEERMIKFLESHGDKK